MSEGLLSELAALKKQYAALDQDRKQAYQKTQAIRQSNKEVI